jgi:hypothetical protein
LKIYYIRVCGVNYYPKPKGVQDRECVEGVYEPYCIITKLSNGKYKIEYQDHWKKEFVLIAYPSGIEEIHYKKE